jgi:hypothetical protein
MPITAALALARGNNSISSRVRIRRPIALQLYRPAPKGATPGADPGARDDGPSTANENPTLSDEPITPIGDSPARGRRVFGL